MFDFEKIPDFVDQDEPSSFLTDFDTRSISSSYLNIMESWAIGQLKLNKSYYLIERVDEYGYKCVVGTYSNDSVLSGIQAYYYRVSTSQYNYEWKWKVIENGSLSVSDVYQSDITNIYTNISSDYMRSSTIDNRLSDLQNSAFIFSIFFLLIFVYGVRFISKLLWNGVDFGAPKKS